MSSSQLLLLSTNLCSQCLQQHNEAVKSLVLVVVFIGVTSLFVSATISLVGLSVSLVEMSDVTLDLEQYIARQPSNLQQILNQQDGNKDLFFPAAGGFLFGGE